MYATVRHLSIKASYQDENKRRVHDQLLPKIQAIPGFVDYYLIYTDEETEISFGLFRDKKGAEAMNKMADEFVKGIGPNVKLTSITQGEIVVQSRVPAYA